MPLTSLVTRFTMFAHNDSVGLVSWITGAGMSGCFVLLFVAAEPTGGGCFAHPDCCTARCFSWFGCIGWPFTQVFFVFGAALLLIQFGALIAPFTHVFLVFGAALLLVQFGALLAPFAHVFFVFGAALLLIQFGALIAPFTHVFLQ
jgi:hypothetical protein